MKRVQFVVVGRHVLLPVTIGYLISQGYALVVNPQDVDPHHPVFLLVGAEVQSRESAFNLFNELRAVSVYNWPVLLLSSSSVYSDRDHTLKMLEPHPMDEAQAHVITSPLDDSAVRPLTALMAEHVFLMRETGRAVIIRPFNVYGPGCHHGVVNNFVEAAINDKDLIVHPSGRQTRTFLWVEDYLDAVGALAQRLLKGHRGIYNVGSTEQVSIISLARSVGQAFNKTVRICTPERVDERHVFWKLPALDRVRVDAKFHPKMSLRSGLFHIARAHAAQSTGRVSVQADSTTSD